MMVSNSIIPSSTYKPYFNRSGSKFQVKLTSRYVKVKWSVKKAKPESEYLVKLELVRTSNALICYRKTKTAFFERKLHGGQKYKLTIDLLNSNNESVESTYMEFYADYTLGEREQLYQKAVDINVRKSASMRNGLFESITRFHRCTAPENWPKAEEMGRVQVTPQKTGHKASGLANSGIECVCLGTHLYNSCPITFSPFGSSCKTIYHTKLFNPEKRSLFFIDVYCFHGPSKKHAVALILARKGSKQEKQCIRKKFLQLDMRNNDLLYLDANNDLYVAKHLFVNVMYAHDIPYRWFGSSFDVFSTNVTPGIMPIYENCPDCELYYQE